jgi:hypothetical protein
MVRIKSANRAPAILAAMVAVLAQSCAPTHKGIALGSAQRLRLETAMPLTASGLSSAAADILHAFDIPVNADPLLVGASADADRTSPAVSRPDASRRALASFFEALRANGVSISRLRPGDYESLYALSNLPVVLGVLTMHFPDKRFEPLEAKSLPPQSLLSLTKHPERLRLHLAVSMKSAGETYIVDTKDGVSWQGLADERLAGQVITIDQPKASGYGQIVGHMVFSSLPITEIRGYLDEWYSAFPATHSPPSVERIE